MSPPTPLSNGFAGLGPSAWQDAAALGRTAPPSTPSASPQNRGDWFSQPGASARVFSVQPSNLSNTDVDAWAQQLVNHLLEPTDALR